MKKKIKFKFLSQEERDKYIIYLSYIKLAFPRHRRERLTRIARECVIQDRVDEETDT